MSIFRHMAADNADDMRRWERFIHADVGHRLLRALLEVGDRLGYSRAESFQIDPCYTHEELATMVGLVRTTVSELIDQFRRRNVLSGYGHCLIVNRRTAEQFLLEYQA